MIASRPEYAITIKHLPHARMSYCSKLFKVLDKNAGKALGVLSDDMQSGSVKSGWTVMQEQAINRQTETLHRAEIWLSLRNIN